MKYFYRITSWAVYILAFTMTSKYPEARLWMATVIFAAGFTLGLLEPIKGSHSNHEDNRA